ncbi:DUF1570 domain-containing protein [Planctomicrobium sp. SH664]|uniref:DUF1570 domain-containing protein n=1 Tax=Planctomicrobium sp. SH664 TaxID=3448125 RepID=UPI003F5B8500
MPRRSPDPQQRLPSEGCCPGTEQARTTMRRVTPTGCVSSTLRTTLRGMLLVGLVLCTSGCPHRGMMADSLPNKYEVATGELILRSDLKISADHELLKQLKQIRIELTQLLELPHPHRAVVVHLFGDEARYAEYMRLRHPNLPPRRAFFIGSSIELGVYAHWSPNVAEDLRHEYTHGVLHASLRTVPLWLDEGLAEYFEVVSEDQRRLHAEHTSRLKLALRNGWRPDLARLEQIEDVAQMRTADYQEAWAWVHYLLHDAADGRGLLVDYCRSLRKSDKPPRFSELLARNFHDADTRLASYISLSLGREMTGSDVQWASGTAIAK